MQSDFVIPDPTLCYLDGNSLGRLPAEAAKRLASLVQTGWGEDLIRGWNKDWINLPLRLGNKLSRLIGAKEGEVVVADSTSVNLFKLATAALRHKNTRTKIVTDATNFPSDLYILESAAAACEQDITITCVGCANDVDAPLDRVIEAIDSDTALVCLTHVGYRSGAIMDIESVNRAARKAGALVLWDFSHSIGAVPIDVQETKVDMAVGCTYKYLCGGPGAPALLFVRKDLQAELFNPIQGWFSHRSPFEFDLRYEAADGIERFLTGTPPVLSMAAIEAGVDLVLSVGSQELRERSKKLTALLVSEVEQHCGRFGFELRSPAHAEARGSHVSFGHPEARRITANLIERHNVIPDFRAPDNLRVGIAPLYTSEGDIRVAVDALVETMEKEQYREIEVGFEPVT